MDYWRGGGGKGYVAISLENYWGVARLPPPVPTPMKGYKANFKYFMPRMVCTDECGTK